MRRYQSAYRIARRLGRARFSTGSQRKSRRSAKRSSAGWDAGGLTSREIASHLSLGPRTVEMHIHRILGKLDCPTRVDITRRAAELGAVGVAKRDRKPAWPTHVFAVRQPPNASASGAETKGQLTGRVPRGAVMSRMR